VTCTDGTSATVSDGAEGPAGPQGPPGTIEGDAAGLVCELAFANGLEPPPSASCLSIVDCPCWTAEEIIQSAPTGCQSLDLDGSGSPEIKTTTPRDVAQYLVGFLEEEIPIFVDVGEFSISFIDNRCLTINDTTGEVETQVVSVIDLNQCLAILEDAAGCP
jgi:hypothetical protein